MLPGGRRVDRAPPVPEAAAPGGERPWWWAVGGGAAVRLAHRVPRPPDEERGAPRQELTG